VSETPARAAGLDDRGVIEAGRRADRVIVDAAAPGGPRLEAVIAGGRVVHLRDVGRLRMN
jgi:alpha-D-ribose 1-methylphosphonate 5-triphosphate diphosphatase